MSGNSGKNTLTLKEGKHQFLDQEKVEVHNHGEDARVPLGGCKSGDEVNRNVRPETAQDWQGLGVLEEPGTMA